MKIFLSVFLLIGFSILFKSCFSAGNIGYVEYIPNNLSLECIQSYSNKIDSLYQVPKELSFYELDYDHIDIHNYYFDDFPEALYRVSYGNSMVVLSIYCVEEDRVVNNKTKISKIERKKIQERMFKKILYPIRQLAVNEGMSKDQIYKNIDCEDVKKCY